MKRGLIGLIGGEGFKATGDGKNREVGGTEGEMHRIMATNL